MDTRYRDFLEGFAYGAGVVDAEAENVWRDYSSLMPEENREEIEGGGYHEGISEGIAFAQWERKNA